MCKTTVKETLTVTVNSYSFKFAGRMFLWSQLVLLKMATMWYRPAYVVKKPITVTCAGLFAATSPALWLALWRSDGGPDMVQCAQCLHVHVSLSCSMEYQGLLYSIMHHMSWHKWSVDSFHMTMTEGLLYCGHFCDWWMPSFKC